MKKKFIRFTRPVLYVGLVVGLTIAGAFLVRGIRLYNMATDLRAQIRYQVDNEGTADAVPASTALGGEYLKGIFGHNPELLDKLQGVVQKGMEDIPSLNLGEVTAMVVTYRRAEPNAQGDEVKDVVAHVMGGFPLGKLKPGFHQDGYFKHILDRQLFDIGQSGMNFLGRDLVLFCEEQLAGQQQRLIESTLNGDVGPLIENLEEPLYFTMVLPEPRKLVPRPLRRHIQAVVIKGMLSNEKGFTELIVLTPSVRSAQYTERALKDMQRLAELTLRTRFKGIVQSTPYGPKIDPWWAYEIVTTSENSEPKRFGNIIRIRSDYSRVMVNAIVKSVERMGLDLARMQDALDERLDPRLAFIALKERPDKDNLYKAHNRYWSVPHEAGPDWPIPPATNEPASLHTDKFLIPGYQDYYNAYTNQMHENRLKNLQRAADNAKKSAEIIRQNQLQKNKIRAQKEARREPREPEN